MKRYTIGLDYGSLSGRAVLAEVATGQVVAEAVYAYPHGAMDTCLPDGTPLETGWVLQDPADFSAVLRETIPKILQISGIAPCQVAGIGVDFTSSTVIPVDENLVPLAKLPEFSGRPHAWTKMWKHNAAQPQAEELSKAARDLGLDYPDRYGGAIPYQSLLPKVVQVFREDREVYDRAACFLEAGDYITSLLAGHPTVSSAMAAARAVWSPEGYPDPAFFKLLDPGLADLPAGKLGARFPDCRYAYPGEPVGYLCESMAESLGLPAGIPISAAQMDGYAAMPGIGVTQPGQVMLVMGTSTAVMLLGERRKNVEGITACVPDTYYPGFYGYASGQSSVGDSFAWFVDNCVPEGYCAAARARGISLHQYLTELAAPLEPGETGLVALDWLGGNKSCLANSGLSGLILGLNLKTRPEHIYRALQEATAFGCRVILDAYEGAGVSVRGVVACGGIAGKNPLLMQMYADILGRELEVSTCAQAPALGSAIYAAAAAGCYPDIFSAVAAMGAKERLRYTPDPARKAAYDGLYRIYLHLHDHFGRENPDIMEQLRRGK